MNCTKFARGLFLACFVLYTMATIYWTAQNYDSRMLKYTATTRTGCLFNYDLLAIGNDAGFLVYFVCYSVIVRFLGLFVYGIFGKYFKTHIGQYFYIGNMTFIFSLYICGEVCVNAIEVIGHFVLLLIGIVCMGKVIFVILEDEPDVRRIKFPRPSNQPVRNKLPSRVRFADEQV